MKSDAYFAWQLITRDNVQMEKYKKQYQLLSSISEKPISLRGCKVTVVSTSRRGHFMSFDNIFKRFIILFFPQGDQNSIKIMLTGPTTQRILKPVDPINWQKRPSFCPNGATKAATNVNSVHTHTHTHFNL